MISNDRFRQYRERFDWTKRNDRFRRAMLSKKGDRIYLSEVGKKPPPMGAKEPVPRRIENKSAQIDVVSDEPPAYGKRALSAKVKRYVGDAIF